jgi:DNA-binding LacI/PurR family transcriptional regulator
LNIEQIARLARVSTATVSRAINGSDSVRTKTAERIRKVIAEVGYVPNQSARTLSSGRSQLFGVIISDITNPFFPDLVSSFESRCMECNYDTILTNTNYDVKRLHQCLGRMIERRVEGIAIFTSEMDDQSASMLLRHKVPVVTLAQGLRGTSFHTVFVDHRPGITKAVQHLAQLGHTKIAFIAGPQDLWSAQRRLELFREAMSQSGLPLLAEYIAEGNSRLEGGTAALKQFLKLQQRPTAVISSNDLMALGALKACNEAGLRVPEDLSLIGLDDLQMVSLANPPLTSIQIPRTEIANQAFQTLWESIRDPQMERRECILKTKLILRQSTAAPSSRKPRAGNTKKKSSLK